jgi:hypothetical protein
MQRRAFIGGLASRLREKIRFAGKWSGAGRKIEGQRGHLGGRQCSYVKENDNPIETAPGMGSADDSSCSCVCQRLRGTGANGPPGNIQATAASLDAPAGIAYDTAGNLYIADLNHNVIREVTVAGIITALASDGSGNLYLADTDNHRIRTLAGNASKSFAGDGRIAKSASLARPRGLSVDSAGNIYIADSDNNRIRLIAKTGNITTVAGNGFQGFAGDGGPAVNAALDTPRAPVVQASGVFALSDTRNQLVRQVDLNGVIHTISGNGSGTGSGQGFFETLTLSGASVVAFGTGTLTATFSNSNLTATGQVTLLDITSGSIPSGSATLSANLATFSTSVLTPGVHRLVASYGGDALNAPVTSSVFVVTITPPLITDFTLTATGVTTLHVNPGQTASFTFALQPQGGNVNPPITLTATGLPPGATAVFTPATITSSSAAASFSLAIKTAPLQAKRVPPLSPTRSPLLPISAAICCCRY